MKTDTTTLAPTDAELVAFAVADEFLLFCDEDDFVQIARAVLAKWGAPAPAGGETETCKCCGEGSARIVVRRECDTCTSVYSGVAEHRLQKSLAAPQAQEARVPLTSEQQRCIAEAHNVAACEEYFNARPQIDYIANRRIFEAGFSKGYGITAAQKETP